MKKIVDVFVEEFPHYIEKCREIELCDGLKIHKNRYGFSSFSENLEKFYHRRVKSLRQRGF